MAPGARLHGRLHRPLHVREADAGDTAFLAALYLSTRPELQALPVPRSVIEGIARHQQAQRDAHYAARHPLRQAWVIEHGGQAVGMVLLAQTGEALRILELAVTKHARRQGIARTILRALQDDCDSRQALALRVRIDNLAARKLYDSLGFITVDQAETTLELRWQQG